MTVNPDGTLTYTPDSDWDGTEIQETLLVTATDSTSPWHIHGVSGFLNAITFGLIGDPGHTATNTVTLHITVANTAPVAADDSNYAVNEDTTLVVGAAAGVLANDTDAEGGPLSAVLVDGPDNAQAFTLNPDGSFSYTPNADWSGTDTFTYQAKDARDATSNEATVTVTVANLAPTATNDENYQVNEGTTLIVDAAHGVLANDTDPGGGPLTAQWVAGPAHAEAFTLNPDGSFSYTPAPGWVGTTFFAYRAVDAQGATSDIALVRVDTHNLAPTAADDTDYQVNQATTLIVDAAHGVLANDSDPGGGPLTAQLVDDARHGDLVLNADGSFTYTPAADWAGPDTFKYRAVDSQGATSRIAIALVMVRNLAPTAVDDPQYLVNEDTTLTVDAAHGVLANDTDPGGDPLITVLRDRPAHAEAFTLNDDGSFSYTPAADWSGTDTFTYLAVDSHSESSRTAATVTVTVSNLAPTASDDEEYTVDEDTTLVVDAAHGVLANDTDPGGGPLTAQLVDYAGPGDLTLHGDGSFSYTPAADWSGTDTFTYQAKDARDATSHEATVSITVNPIEDAVRTSVEVGSADPATGNVTVTLTASDPDGDSVKVGNTDPTHGSVTVVNNHNGTWTYTYDPTDAARLHAGLGGDNTDGFTVTVTDSNGASTDVSTGAIAIAPVQGSVDTVTVGPGPGGVAVVGDNVYVGNGGNNTVSVIDSENNVTTPITLNYSPGSMAVSGTDVYVTSWGQSALLVIHTADNTWSPVTGVSRPMVVAVTDNNLYAYAANYGSPGTGWGHWVGHTVTKIDLTTGTSLQVDTGGNYPYGVVVKGENVYVSNSGSNTVAVIEISDNALGVSIPVGSRPMGMAVNGDYIYVANFNDGTVSVIDTTSNEVVGTPITVGGQPNAVAFSPDGSLAYVANYGDGTVTVIDTATRMAIDMDSTDPDVDNIPVGSYPANLAVRPDGTLYVTNSGSNTVSVISLAP